MHRIFEDCKVICLTSIFTRWLLVHLVLNYFWRFASFLNHVDHLDHDLLQNNWILFWIWHNQITMTCVCCRKESQWIFKHNYRIVLWIW
jgi:hypothetical protein